MLPSWGGSADHMRNLFIRQTPESSGVWKDIQVIEDIDRADYCVQMDRPKDGLKYPSKTIYMNWEPQVKASHYVCDDYKVAKRILFE